MGFRDFMYTEKGRLTTGILAAVLITTAVLVPVSIFADRAIRGEDTIEGITTFGYDDNVTSTGLRQDNWMGIDATTMIDSSGDEVTSMEATLSQNANYHGVIQDEELLDGVEDTDGLAYLSNSHVSQRDQLEALSIKKITGDTPDADYINPGEDEYISAPLNMNLKVPEAVAEVVKGHLAPESTPLRLDEFSNLTNDFALSDELESTTPSSYNYADYLSSNKSETDFALSVILFNWIAQGPVDYDGIYTSINKPAFDNDTFREWVKTVFDDPEWGIFKDGKLTSEAAKSSILIDGTGTDEQAINIAIDKLNKAYEEYGVSLTQELNNGGSYRGWETSGTSIPGVVNNKDEYDGQEDGSPYAFIGTQSRGMEMGYMTSGGEDKDGEISYWGYDESKYIGEGLSANGVDVSDMENIQYDFTKFSDATSGLPLSTTIAADQVVFFTTTDSSFETIDGTKMHPTGITDTGAKMAFQYGVTWNQLYSLNLLEAEEI